MSHPQDTTLPTHTCDAVPQPIPDVVRDSIVNAFPTQAKEILETLHFNHMGSHFYFEKWGMYVGVEWDGYIHT